MKDVYRKRAAVIGFRCGVIFHLLSMGSKNLKSPTSNLKESKACLNFALMMAEYCLSQQIKTFGETLRHEYVCAQDECQRYGSNHTTFDLLAPTFTKDDIRSLKRNSCGESALYKIISRWNRDGWIEQVDKTHWKKVSVS